MDAYGAVWTATVVMAGLGHLSWWWVLAAFLLREVVVGACRREEMKLRENLARSAERASIALDRFASRADNGGGSS